MRIIFINVEEKIAGAEKSLLLTFDELKNRCGEIILLSPPGQLSETAVSKGISWKKLPVAPRTKWTSVFGMIHIFRLFLHLLYHFVKCKPNIIHVNGIAAAYASWLPCILAKSKLIFHVRDIPRRRLAYRFIGYRSAGVIAVSEFICSLLINAGIPANKIFTVFNPFDESTHKQRHFRFTGAYVFANIGQIVPWKRQELFIEAAKIVAEKQIEAHFWLIGDDLFDRNRNYKNYILNKIETAGLNGRIKFKGWQNNMDDVWSQIDCLVHTADNEPFGRVVIEAMEASVPVIASNSGGPSEIIENGKTGFLVARDEPEIFAQAMFKVYSNQEKTFEIVDSAKKYSATYFTKSSMCDKLMAVYEKVLAK